MNDHWEVMRHSGRRNGRWRIVFQGDEAGARAAFDREVAAMRQGDIRLVDPIRTLVDRKWAPNLRTRW